MTIVCSANLHWSFDPVFESGVWEVGVVGTRSQLDVINTCEQTNNK